VYIAILVFYLVFAYFMYPETKHHTIEEISVIFDRRKRDIEELSDLAIQKVEKMTSARVEHHE
jgi:hypothetical protein